MKASRLLTFHATIWSLILGAVLLVASVPTSFITWRRSAFAWKVGVLEFLRLVIVSLIVITLNQPEWLESFQPDEKPVLALISDASASMNTRDIRPASDTGEVGDTRAEWIHKFLQRDMSQHVRQDLTIDRQTFASSPGDASEGTDINAALMDVLEKHPNLRAAVLLSDGDWNMGESPSLAATRYRIQGIPVHTVAVGGESRLPDVEIVGVNAPTFGVIGKPTRIPFVIESSLPNDYETSLTIIASTGEQLTKSLRIPAMGRLDDAIYWKPNALGDVTLTASIPHHKAELYSENNERTVRISIRQEGLQVLVVESIPRWEYRYLRNALMRDPGVNVECLLFHPDLSQVGGGKGYIKEFPATRESLARYDVVFLGDVGIGERQLTDDDCRLLKGLIQRQASGLILMPGLRGRQFRLAASELDDLMPVVMDERQSRGWGGRVPSQFELTTAGRQSLLTKLGETESSSSEVWSSLPGFQWYAPVLRAKAGSEVLAVHPTHANDYGRLPLLVTKTYGTGKVLFMGTDGAWRWREGVEDKYHYRFWGQVIRWMAYQRNMAADQAVRFYYSPDRPDVGDTVSLNANVVSPTGEPLQSGSISVRLIAPSGRTEVARLDSQSQEWGLFSGEFTPDEPGDYQVTLHSRENDAKLETIVSVQAVSRERLGQPARHAVLEEIASITRGRMVSMADAEKILPQIAQLPDAEPTTRRVRVWCHPLWVGWLVTMLVVFWSGRKMIGAT